MKIISLDKGCFAFILGLLLWCSHMHAHYLRGHSHTLFWQSAISGTVSDSQGPLPGVTIMVKGASVATVSDDNGRYTIPAAIGDTLIFSFIGFKPLERVAGAQVLNVVLEQDNTQLEEVVINAGYYSVTQKEATGSISRITAKDIEKQPVSNPLAALQGRMAGVDVVQNTGVPGGGFSIKIRGRNSLRAGGNEPLYIVDGMPFSAENGSSENAYQGILPFGGSSPLNGLSPNDIESIEILKDADATAIYGSRGANGVVLITTKKGKSEKTRFTVNAYTGAGSVTRFMKLMNTPQYLAMRRQAFANDGFEELPDWAYDVNGTWDQNRYTDWQEELIGGTAISQNIEAGISGGSESTRYLVRGTSFKEGTVFPGDFSFRKSALHLNLNHRSADGRFGMNFSANYVATKNDLPGTDLTYRGSVLPPNAPALYDSQGQLNWENSTWENPLAVLNQEYLAKSANLTAGASFNYRIAEGLEAKTYLGYVDIDLYWNIGRYIHTKIERSEWGKSIVEELALYLQQKDPGLKGFSDKNLWRMRQFYEAYKDNEKLSAVLREISWTNNMTILGRAKTVEERAFYLELCRRERFSSRELERQISSGAYERTMLGNVKLSAVMRELHPEAANTFKDSYIFDFLDLSGSYDESDLQKGLIRQMKDFILELGKDFLFFGEEYKLQVGSSDFYIDLLFYHRGLQCLVAFELKADKFRPEHLGQLNFYLEALDRDVKKPHENPSIGILLCKDKDNEVVEYSLSRSLSPSMVAEYRTKLPDKKLLQQKMNEIFTGEDFA